jgi:hypothetical protein
MTAIDPRSELIRIIRHVRRRWRLKLALRGAAAVAAVGVIVLLAAAFGLEWARFSARAILAARVLVAAALAVSTAYLFVRPLLRRVTDEQVALYIEEHEPSLQASIVSAIEGASAARSDALLRRLIESAVDKCAETHATRTIERAPMQRYAGTVLATMLAAAAIFMLGPGFLRHALSALVLVSRGVEAAAPYRIEVTPGHATVPKGADQTVTARLHGFDAEQATLHVRKSPSTPFEPLPMVRGEHQYDGMLFDLAGSLEYFVEAAGVRSPVFNLKVVDLPYVKKLELEYHFPAYTGLAPQKVEDGGDIVVLRGTEVRVRVTPTMASRGGRVALNEKSGAALTPGADGTLTTRFTVDHDGFYRVELDAAAGERVAASPQYLIDVLTDQSPSVAFNKPGRDTSVSPIEEVFVEARASDDFGVRGLELVYSVNGAPEKTVRLFDGRNRLPEVTAGHTFYLEELDVKAGDAVSYYARASDNDSVQGGKQATSDLYFLRIRPFRKDFRQAQSQAGGGGGGGMNGGQADALSAQQRQIIAATFNVQRSRKTSSADKLRENTVVVSLSQSRLREQVEGLVSRMNSRLVEPDPAFQKIAELLPKAVAEMKTAEAQLQAIKPEGALPPEQRALQFLQKAEEEYELQVSVNRGGGGGGGGAGSVAEDLADMFEMELDRMANQYETRARASQEGADQQVDALLEKLKELARRQEQEAERQRRRAVAGMPSAGGGGGQRALADEVEEAARRLERLSREEARPELMDSARQLREAADAMRRASAGGDASAQAQASAALQRLRETERRLRRSQSARAERDVNDARQQAQEIAREQREIEQDVNALAGESGKDTNTRAERVRRLRERKDSLESKVGELEKQLDRSAADASRDERDAARKMSEAAATIRDSRVRDKIRYSKAVIAGASSETAQRLESDIGANLEAVRNKLGEAASALGRSRPDSQSAALDRARRLAEGLQSLGERMRERSQEGSKGSEGSRGSEGSGSQSPQGSEGSRGAQGAQSARGAEGAQGGQNDGRATQGGQRGDGDTFGGWRGNAGGYGDRRYGRLSPEDIRQFRGEVRQWSGEVQALRKLLRSERIDPKELDAILRALRELDDDRVFKDAAELERLQAFVSEGMKRFEYMLRRKAEAKDGEVVLSGSDEVPEQFRALVEQYYRSLSKAPR